MVFIFVGIIFQGEKIKNTISGRYTVVETTSIGPIIKVGRNRVLLNEYDGFFNKGDIIDVKGQISIVQNKTSFNIENYLKSYNTYSMIEKPEINMVSLSKNIESIVSS